MKPEYFCTQHSLLLTEQVGEAVCPSCREPYPIHGDIWMLDSISRPDRLVFDQQVEVAPIPLDIAKAHQLLVAGNIPRLADANILDVGCGLGDLAHGLAQSSNISHSRIYAFDHSVKSLRKAASFRNRESTNQVFFSAQDALHLYFGNQTFDLVLGSAVLHHLIDYAGFFREAARILKPGGVAVFSEPFFEGYFWPALFLKSAMEEHGLSASHEITDLVSFMARHRGNDLALNELTDKHFFLESEVIAAGMIAGFKSVRFSSVAPSVFYSDWMEHFLDIYSVSNKAVRSSAIAKYQQVADLAGPMLPNLMCHFKYIVMSI